MTMAYCYSARPLTLFMENLLTTAVTAVFAKVAIQAALDQNRRFNIHSFMTASEHALRRYACIKKMRHLWLTTSST